MRRTPCDGTSRCICSIRTFSTSSVGLSGYINLQRCLEKSSTHQSLPHSSKNLNKAVDVRASAFQKRKTTITWLASGSVHHTCKQNARVQKASLVLAGRILTKRLAPPVDKSYQNQNVLMQAIFWCLWETKHDMNMYNKHTSEGCQLHLHVWRERST